MKTRTDKEIAQLVVELCDKHEKSWNGQTYTAGNIKLMLRDALKDVPGGFAKMLTLFCVSWTSDCYEVCKEVLREEQQ